MTTATLERVAPTPVTPAWVHAVEVGRGVDVISPRAIERDIQREELIMEFAYTPGFARSDSGDTPRRTTETITNEEAA